MGIRQADEKAKAKLRPWAETTDSCFGLDLLLLRPDLVAGWHLSDSYPTRYGFPDIRNGCGILRDVRRLLQALSRRLRGMWVPLTLENVPKSAGGSGARSPASSAWAVQENAPMIRR